eukprot:2323396-Rhodomonas_salina.1
MRRQDAQAARLHARFLSELGPGRASAAVALVPRPRPPFRELTGAGEVCAVRCILSALSCADVVRCYSCSCQPLLAGRAGGKPERPERVPNPNPRSA